MARDGGICREKLPFCRLSAAQAEAVADASERFCSGVSELTSCANLQIRGVDAQGSEALVRLLRDSGLGPKDPLADDVRNVMASPLAGIDSAQLIDSAELGAEVLALLEGDAELARPLPGAEDYLAAEVVYAAAYEGARHLDDVLARRTRISIETFDRGVTAAPRVAELMAGVLGWSDEQREREVAHYHARVDAEIRSQHEPDDHAADAVRLGAPEIVPLS